MLKLIKQNSDKLEPKNDCKSWLPQEVYNEETMDYLINWLKQE